MGRIGQELFEIVAGGTVKGETGGLAELGVEVLELFVLELALGFEDFRLGRGQDAIKPPQDRERKDHVLVFAALERVADEVGDTPDETDDFAMVQGLAVFSAKAAIVLSMRRVRVSAFFASRIYPRYSF